MTVIEELDEVVIDHFLQPRNEGVHRGVPRHLGGIDQHLSLPDQSGAFAQIDDVLEEAAEDVEAHALPDLDEARAVRERLVQWESQIPAMDEVQSRCLNQLSLGTNTLKESDQLEAKEDLRIDRGTSDGSVQIGQSLADEREVELRVEMAVEVISGDEGFEGGENGPVEPAGLALTEHGGGAPGFREEKDN